MNGDWNESLVEVLNSLNINNPKRIYIVGCKLSDIIYFKLTKRNVQIKSLDHLLNLMEEIIIKSDSDLAKIVDCVKDDDIPIELNEDIDVVNKQRWSNFKKLCKLSKLN